MSTLIITTARAAGQTLAAAGKQYAKSYVRRRLRQAFDGRNYDGPRLENFHILSSQDGAPMARVYGRARLAGQIIWASKLKEHVTKERIGGKGGPTRKNFSYTMSFAIGLCEGEIMGVERLWVNGAPFSPHGLSFRVYKGSEDQLPDPVISAIEGMNAPAFRGAAYMVFEDFPLDDYGARLPQFNAEILRMPAAAVSEPCMEDLVTGVNLIPASGEYAYATDIVEDVTGQAVPVNMNNLAGQPDLERALDQLETQLPNCRNISLIVSWFGSDLRAGLCEIKPGIEARDRLTIGMDWRVCGQTRETAYLVSQDANGRPHYGGTPSDASVLQAIAAFKARGFKVTLYPFILMDITPGNGLPDPYGQSEQAAFPWRGRITSGADMNAAASADIDAFFGACSAADFGVVAGDVIYNGPAEFSFRRFILHYAKLAEMAGGIDRFVIGSEMRGITTARASAGVYPSVPKLKALAADVRSIVGAETGLTYAADWSEYFGHHTGGDVNFHLDPLWADPNIDAVGIDAYFPLSDWRDGEHLDGALAASTYDPDYLSGNMEGGEGYDWYYAGAANREAQIRTPITDGAAGKPWVYRYKDIRNWWQNAHYNRVGGIELSAPTDWTPESKPIWFTEVGCPAIDKGANQPNVFVDPKSSESHAPYHSNGARDDLIQRRYIETFLRYWQENNQISSVYSGPMVDLGGAHIWCWDARPFPDFPARDNVWSDGVNWQLGHWLSGRTGLVPLRDVIKDVARQCGVETVNTDHVHGMIDGYVLDRPMSGRAALEPLTALYGIGLQETAAGLVFSSQGQDPHKNLTLDDIAGDLSKSITLTTPDPGENPVDIRLHFIDRAKDFQIGMVSAQDRLSESVHAVDLSVPVVMGAAQAKTLSAHILALAQSSQHLMDFTLSPACLEIEAGDRVSVPRQSGIWQIEEITEEDGIRVLARPAQDSAATILSGFEPEALVPVPWVSAPELFVLDIAQASGTGARNGVLVGARAEPFNPVTVSGPDGGIELTAPAAMGHLLTPLKCGPVGHWDSGNICDIHMPGIDLASVDELALLSGENRFAVETETGWEIIQACQIELIGPQTFRLSHLLRGLAGTDADMMDTLPIGARAAYLNQGFADMPVSNARIGDDVTFLAEAAGRTSAPLTGTYHARHLRPLSPVHGKAEIIGGDLHLSWIRRTRIGGDSWAGLDVPLGEDSALYRVEFWDGNTRLKTYDVETESLTVPAADLAAMGTFDHVTVSQGSLAAGFGASLTINCTGI